MSKEIKVLTRVEGHAKVTLVLDEKGNLEDARFHVLEFKGFEKFMQGRILFDAPRITTRVCGICPVSHHLASVKACEDLLSVEIPQTAKLLRELMHMGQFIHSHALHFFFLAAPDFILGADTPPQSRNVLGLLKADPELVKKAIKIRKFGQDLIELLGGKAIHPVTAIPGGMSKGLSKNDQERLLKELKELIPLFEEVLYICNSNLLQQSEFITNFAVIDTNFLGLIKNDGLELYDGQIRANDSDNNNIFDISSNDYFKYISEHIEPWTYLKFPYLKGIGWPKGIYRVGPLARLNICDGISTPKAHAELHNFRRIYGHPAKQTLAYHHARLVELLYAFERAEEILNDPDVYSENIRVKVKKVAGEGIGVVEAPRGTLIHHYKSDSNGKLTDVNLIVATVNNNPSINKAIKEAALGLVKDGKIAESDLNKIEMTVRAFDPCLTCAAHSTNMVTLYEIVDVNGQLVKRIYR